MCAYSHKQKFHLHRFCNTLFLIVNQSSFLDASPVSPPVHLSAGEQLSPPARTADIGLASQSVHPSSPPVASVVESASMSVYVQSHTGSSATSPPPPSSEPGTKANAGPVHISPTVSCRSGSSCHSLGRFCRICHEGQGVDLSAYVVE